MTEWPYINKGIDLLRNIWRPARQSDVTTKTIEAFQ